MYRYASILGREFRNAKQHIKREDSMKRVKITLLPKNNQVKAELVGQPNIWDVGKSAEEALGRLVARNTDRFGIKVENSTDNCTQSAVRRAFEA